MEWWRKSPLGPSKAAPITVTAGGCSVVITLITIKLDLLKLWNVSTLVHISHCQARKLGPGHMSLSRDDHRASHSRPIPFLRLHWSTNQKSITNVPFEDHSSGSWPSSLQSEWCNDGGAQPRNIFGIINVDFQLLKMSIVTFILIYVSPEIRDQRQRAVDGQLLGWLLF